MMLPIGFVLIFVGVLWLTRSSRGRLALAVGRIGRPRLGRAGVAVFLWGTLYGVAAYYVQRSVLLAIVAAGSIAATILIAPWTLWRMFVPELRRAGL